MLILDIIIAALLLISLIFLIIGLISPRISLFWFKGKKTRVISFLIYLSATCVFFVAFLVVFFLALDADDESDSCIIISAYNIEDLYKIKSVEELKKKAAEWGFEVDNSAIAKMASKNMQFIGCEKQELMTDSTGLFGGMRTHSKKQFDDALKNVSERGKQITNSAEFDKNIAGFSSGAKAYLTTNGYTYNFIPFIALKDTSYIISISNNAVRANKPVAGSKETSAHTPNIKGNPGDYLTLTELQNLALMSNAQAKKKLEKLDYEYYDEVSTKEINLYVLPYTEDFQPPTFQKYIHDQAIEFYFEPEAPLQRVKDSLKAFGYEFYKKETYQDIYKNEYFFLGLGKEKMTKGKSAFVIRVTKIKVSDKKEDSNNLTPSKEINYNYDVDSYTRKTDLHISKGSKVSLTASGEITLGMFAGSGDPNGIDGFESYCINQNFRHGSLLFKIGNGEWMATGEQTSIIAKTSGILQFMVNDSDPSNNSGSFKVNVRVK